MWHVGKDVKFEYGMNGSEGIRNGFEGSLTETAGDGQAGERTATAMMNVRIEVQRHDLAAASLDFLSRALTSHLFYS